MIDSYDPAGHRSGGSGITIIFRDHPDKFYGFESKRDARKWLRGIGLSSTSLTKRGRFWYGAKTPSILLNRWKRE